MLEHKDNKPLPIYRNIKCLAGFYVKPQHINLFSTTRCIISFLYIKPQPNSGDSWEVPVVLYRFSTSNHNSTLLACSQPYVVLYRFSTSSHTFPCMPFRLPRVVLYRFSTSNHNMPVICDSSCMVVLYRFSTPNHNLRLFFKRHIWLYYIVSLHQTTTHKDYSILPFELYYIVSLHQTTTFDTPQRAQALLYYIVFLHQTTTQDMHRVEPPCCIISFLYIKPQHRVAGEVKTRLLLSMVFFLLYLAKDVKLKVDALNKCLKLRMPKSYARSKLFVFHICTFLGFYVFGLPCFLVVS